MDSAPARLNPTWPVVDSWMTMDTDPGASPPRPLAEGQQTSRSRGCDGCRGAVDGKGRWTGSRERNGGSDFGFGGSEVVANICEGKGVDEIFGLSVRVFFFFTVSFGTF
jgi:hypothetical protein